MSRITISLAEDMAKEMTSELAKEIKDLKSTLGSEVEEHLLKGIPKDVLSCYKKHPDYIETTSYVYLRGQGLNHDSVNLNNSIPVAGRTTFDLPKEISLSVSKQLEVIKSKEAEKTRLYKEVKNVLIDLKTFKRVREEFPEAAKFLPKEDKQIFLPSNLKTLRAKFQ